MTLQSGARLGPYEILAPLGAGGMGEVYRARDTRLDRTVAIKVLPEPVAGDPDRRLRFTREARAAGFAAPVVVVTAYGTIEDAEYRTATESRLDARNTRRNRNPQLFSTAGDLGAAQAIVWKSLSDAPTRRMVAGAEYAISELGGIQTHSGLTAPLAAIVISEKTGLPLTLTARSEPGHGSMPWPDTAPNRLVRALNRLLEAERPLRVLPEVQEFFSRMAGLLPSDQGAGYDDLARSLQETAFRARFFANRQFVAMVRTTFALTMLRGSEKSNVIPPEAAAQIDCRMLAGDDPEEIAGWVRRVIDDPNVQVEIAREAKVPNLSPPDTELYKAMADTLRRRAPALR